MGACNFKFVHLLSSAFGLVGGPLTFATIVSATRVRLPRSHLYSKHRVVHSLHPAVALLMARVQRQRGTAVGPGSCTTSSGTDSAPDRLV